MCIQLTHFAYGDCENTCILSYYHHQIGRMTHFPLFRVRSWNSRMRCMCSSILRVNFDGGGVWSAGLVVMAVDKYTMRHSFHDDVMKWKHFPRYWPFVRGIHRSPVNSTQSFHVLSQSRSLWRHRNVLCCLHLFCLMATQDIMVFSNKYGLFQE